ncbi:MAG: hypothetical protein NTV34_03865 [Proteobacteria bacterium]|nr:hypothetical protein [Pseudomonadota bacterium]
MERLMHETVLFLELGSRINATADRGNEAIYSTVELSHLGQ